MSTNVLINHVTLEAGCAQFDHIAAIADLTDTARSEWSDVDGPQSGVGESYWYIHEARGLTAYVSNDQQFVSLEICNDASDVVATAEIDLNQFE
ncbi:hypothetical protein [Sphingomonas crocodyli]|uniref:Uncharacterized protein n=1 Tax=Sphingomonas crocodyli TaxID=1979270 RepID=A0A437LY88_9SPHN|nr:hypothetical protein [Sphingomonas crocodyli]RVT90306.1 hypothetical protein EOD43_18725 [Sphingomonas crocodyli]